MLTSPRSQQEPRLLSHYSTDEHMIQAYKDGKDLYAMIASKVYHNNYEDNKEFNPDGTMNPDGKKRRTSVKSLLLGIMYGMGTPAIAESLHCPIEEAESIKQGFFKEFPKVENWINTTTEDAKINGYVEDVWGRRRRLPDILKDKYEFKDVSTSDFNPILGSLGKFNNKNSALIESYKQQLSKTKFKKDVDKIKQEAENNNIHIHDNSGFIARAERQCVNARIQGGAASMSKRAMINVHNNKELKELGFRLLITVHDELIGECPIENVEQCKQLLSECMINAAKPEVVVPFKCDADSFQSWYLDVYSTEVKKEYDKLCKENSKEEALQQLVQNRCECTKEQILNMINS